MVWGKSMGTELLQKKANQLNRGYLTWRNANGRQVTELCDGLTLGRDGSNHVVLSDSYVSQRHCRIELRFSRFIIRDLRSKNGVFVNGTPVIEAELKDEDCIKLGHSEITVTVTHELNKENTEKERELKIRMTELKKNIEKLEEKYFIKEEMSKETYDRFLLKYREEFTIIQKELDSCAVSISNLQEMLNEVVILSRNLRKLWHEGSIGLKEKLQRLLFPSGLVYDKKNGVFRTPELNLIIAEIARHTGDLAKITKGLTPFLSDKSLLAERVGFEPTIRLPVYKLSRLALSTTQTPHQF